MFVLFDDVDRVLDCYTIISFCRELGVNHQNIRGSRKSFALCSLANLNKYK